MPLINTLGAVVISDSENPRTFTGKAREVISGGEFVIVSGAGTEVGSSVSSFAGPSDLNVSVALVAGGFNGIALNTTGSNGLVTAARQGDYLLRAAGTVIAGQLVQYVSGVTPGVGPLTSGAAIAVANQPIGRAITSSASGTALYSLVSLNL